jgi:cell division protein FtsI/penicillin-binding protein 2
VSQTDLVAVGLEPDRVTDRNALNAAFQQVLQIPAATIDAALARPGVKPNFFVPITTLRPEQFATVRPQLEPVPGVFFQKTKAREAVVDGLASHALGRVGEITAERLKQLGDPYQVGDSVGLSGLEAVFEKQLAGTPSGDVHLNDSSGQTTTVLQSFTGTQSSPISTTLDAAVQTAAERALDGVTQPAALVAVDAASGDIRAIVSRPVTDAFDRALNGLYPPGSTAKVMTTAALLGHGTTPDTPVGCPPSANVGGKTFTNFEGEAPGQIPFRQAFAISCNTAFVGLAGGLPGAALVDAARGFGFDADDKLPLTTGHPQFPAPKDDADKAAEAIGQGRVVATPLHMATVAAAVAGGAWRPPRMLATDPAGAARPLDPAMAGTLRSLMFEVVRSGTGTAAAVAAQAIAGKTGTAEFGPANPPATHAWFIGFRGSLAFAVIVEGGGVGGRVAAPIANRFLTAVPVS